MTSTRNLPLFYHPTNVMAIDDDRSLLNALSAGINQMFPYVLKNSPIKALDYLQTHVYDLRSLSESISESYETLAGSETVETIGIHFSTLRERLDNPDRYKKIVVIITDQMMPEMKGLEFCKKMREMNYPVKLILLTGAAGTEEAVNAFNSGLIDAYISKGEPDLMDTINRKIESLAWDQFREFGSRLLGLLPYQSSILEDENFQTVFNDILLKNDIAEFYLIDSTCSYFLLTSKGDSMFLMVRALSDFDTVYEHAKEEGAPYTVLQSLRDKQAYPFTRLNIPHPIVEGDAWEEIMVPIDKVPGRDIFYALIDISQKDIFYFDKYMGEIWPQP